VVDGGVVQEVACSFFWSPMIRMQDAENVPLPVKDSGFPLARVATLDDALDALADFRAGRTPAPC